MSFNGILEIDNKRHRILNWNIHITQKVDETGRPNANPSGGFITMSIESTESNDFLDWVVSPDMTKSGTIFFQRRDNDTSLLRYEFTDGYCIEFDEDFNAQGNSPMILKIVISAQTVKSGMAELTKNWNKI